MKDNPFDKAAPTWEDNPGRVEFTRTISESILDVLQPTCEMDLLDYGCGTGLLSCCFLPHVKSVTAADSSRGMLEVLGEKIAAAGFDRMRALHLDLEESPPPDERFHLVVTCMTLHHVRDVDRVLGAFYELLHDDGALCIVDLDTEPGDFHRRAEAEWVHHQGFDRQSLIQRLTRQGFTQCTDTTAHVLNRDLEDGGRRDFPIFAITGRRM